MDKMAEDSPLKPLKYDEEVEIPKLGYVDDLLDINNCGDETIEMNEYTRSEISQRKLQFSVDKCARIHVGS